MFLFLSDAHFGIGPSDAQEKRRRFLFECLDHYAPHVQKLFILGDLFDFWFEWRHVILKQHFQVLCKLEEMTARGIELHYMAGNHDFALGRFLQDEVRACVHFDSYQFEADGKKFYLLHGDGLAPTDWGYRILKRIFRNPTNQKFYAWLHPDFGLNLAHRCSFTSRNHSSRRWDVDGWAYRQAAEKQAKLGADYVLFAHTHEPLMEPVNGGVYVNTGDWMKYFSYATFEDNEMTLCYWRQPALRRSESQLRQKLRPDGTRQPLQSI